MKGEFEMNSLQVYFIYIALVVSIISIYEIIEASYKEGKVKINYFLLSLVFWIPVIIVGLFI